MSAPGYTIADTAITVGSTSNWSTDTGVVFAIDEAQVVDGQEVQVAGTYNEYIGVVSSGTSVTSVAWQTGVGDRNYASGALTRVYIPVSAERENRIVEWGLTHADQDGTLKAGAVDNAAVLAINVVETAKIKDGAVSTAKIVDGAVTPNKLATGASSAQVDTSQTTTSTSYADLATTTDTVTVTVGANGLALVSISSFITNNTANAKSYVSFAVSGSNTIAANDDTSVMFQAYAGGAIDRRGAAFLLTGLTPGSSTFKMKYKVETGGSGAGTASFASRRIGVVPL